ncbi:MAG: hypothetical protein FJ100_22490 [Deltaproteobacteria bacterium]|nr:hypothetical protein [Deltaproteobacteria bacterium]
MSTNAAEAAEQASTRTSWALAVKRGFGQDLLQCECGGLRKVMAAVQDADEVERFLRHLGLGEGPEDAESIRGPPELFELAEAAQ